MIDRLMSKAWTESLAADTEPEAHKLPEKPLDDKSYFRGRLIGPGEVKAVRGMAVIVPEWSKIKGSFRSRFAGERLLCGSEPGAEMTLQFEGTAVGAYILAGPDAGIVETSIDGGAYRLCNLYHDYSKGLHYPRTVIFDGDLEPGEHELRLRISAEKDERSSGHAMRVLKFVAN
jgi:hypothetical protein